MKATKAKVPYFETDVTVTSYVEIDPDELHDAGWHHETECGGLANPRPLVVGTMPYAEAVASLHRQAHPSQLSDPATCREETCRSLSFVQLRGGS